MTEQEYINTMSKVQLKSALYHLKNVDADALGADAIEFRNAVFTLQRCNLNFLVTMELEESE